MATMVSGLGGRAGCGEDVFSTSSKAMGNNKKLLNYETSNLGGGGPSGKRELSMAGGVPSMLDSTVVNFTGTEHIICFTPGTMILTPFGERAIETLCPGDLVITSDHGPQPIRWLGSTVVPGLDNIAPITIEPGVLDGATRRLQVSPQHRFLFTGYKAELLFGTSEVFVAAKHLLNGVEVRQDACAKVTYLHLMLDRHEVIYANGTATESFFAGDAGVSSISEPSRDEMFAIFPKIRSDLGSYGNTARICLEAHESRLLIKAELKFGALAAA